MRAEYYALLDRLSEEVKQRYPKKLQMFSPLQPSNMDMVDAVDQLSKVAATYEMNEERLIAQCRLFLQSVCNLVEKAT